MTRINELFKELQAKGNQVPMSASKFGKMMSLRDVGEDVGDDEAVDADTIRLFVPGRVCLMGEHSDWSGAYRRFNPEIRPGLTLVCGTNQGLYAEAKRHPSSLVLCTVDEKGTRYGPHEIPMEPAALLKAAKKGDFWSYAAGVAYKLLTDYNVNGLVINNYRTDLPVKKGLSSSAAICVLVARAFNRCYDMKLTIRGEMEIAYQGEILTPSQCGRMDQACAFGSRVVCMTYDGEFVDAQEVQLSAPLHLVVVDLCASKDTVEILSKLQTGFPFPRNDIEKGVHTMLGTENERLVGEAVQAMKDADAARLGALMREAQGNMDKYGGAICPNQLTAPVLHRVMATPALQPLIYGTKGIGAGGDGTAQFLCKDKAAQDEVIRIVEEELKLSAMPLTIQPASRVREALIPAAAFGGSLFPATKAVHAPLFPVVDPQGRCKPAILTVVEEVVSAGIERVFIIVQEGDKPTFEQLFKNPLGAENSHGLSKQDREYAKKILSIGDKVTFIVQRKQEGFGHAVHSARHHMNLAERGGGGGSDGGNPFLLVLGDHIYRSRSTDGRSCARQVMDAFEKHGKPVMGLKITPGDAVSSFGTATGVWLGGDDDEAQAAAPVAPPPPPPAAAASSSSSSPTFVPRQRLMSISKVIEKPSRATATASLPVPGFPADTFCTAFGMYVVNDDIFDQLDFNIKHNVRELNGRFGFTPILASLAKEGKLNGLLVAGERFDLGHPRSYLATLQKWAQPP